MLQIQNQNTNYNKPKVRNYNKAYNLEAEFQETWRYMKEIGEQDQLKKVQVKRHETVQQMKGSPFLTNRPRITCNLTVVSALD